MSVPFDKEAENEGRTLAHQAAARYIDQWEHTEGSIVTGYVLIAETVRPDGTVDLIWFGGNGMPTENLQGGLAAWRINGMCHRVIMEVDAVHQRHVRGEGGEEG